MDFAVNSAREGNAKWVALNHPIGGHRPAGLTQPGMLLPTLSFCQLEFAEPAHPPANI